MGVPIAIFLSRYFKSLAASVSLQLIQNSLFSEKQVQVYLKREDLIHPTISGNKWRKLKYNLYAAREQQKTTLLTFGGAYSNHIAAVAAAGQEFGFETIGYIRGEEHFPLNPTLALAKASGMQLEYLDRETYREKSHPDFLRQIEKLHPTAYIIPEGGTNMLAVKGCTEIVQDIPVDFDYICCAAGTGGTLAGIITGLAGEKTIIGFPALKGGEFLKEDIRNLIRNYTKYDLQNWVLETNYHFGGYAKIKPELVSFIQHFKQEHHIQLDPIYTGKMMFGVYDLIQQDYFNKGSVIIAVHTGGLQGIKGLEERLGIILG
ncbi:1-aminocyclopropane-1-carboxylate deaminase/D-cysteine desulfhydrase [Adhaeribacter aquaticus]|uniref:1-aminocyclopropane-1-carboxylate deaminase/D-cysteine desulfhydrase n=1 Tax=Adhaeribacter aquaticus TaxID=299567 RepID=UPI0003F4F281|nr:pyridoxal-phosphate dependent enzyme [Adhaeribacter aquaticus]